MESKYTLRATICAPIDKLYEANQLACIVGEHEDDIRTFVEATHERDGVQYACVSTVVKDVFGVYPFEGLPDPPHAAAADRAAAEEAFRDLNKPGEIVYSLTLADGPSGSEILASLGFEPLPMEAE